MDHQYQGTTYHGSVQQMQSGNVYQSVENRNPWQTGWIKRLPVAGVLAMLGALAGIGVCAAILVVSNNQPIVYWKFQPTVYLAICSTLTNIFLAFALSEGADIAWWRKASRERTTVGDLHRVWDHSRSFKSALLSGRNVTLVAVACLLATIAQINSPLLQRASTVVVKPVELSTKVTFRAAAAMPKGFTGYLSGRGSQPSLFTPQFRDIVMQWNNNASIVSNSTGCTGVCRTNVYAMGIAVNCSGHQTPFSVIPKVDSNGNLNFSDPSIQGVNVFTSSWSLNIYGRLDATVQYKGTDSCQGLLTVEQCTIQPAYMQVPVEIINSSYVSLAPNTTVFSDKVSQIIQIPFEETQGPSTFGGYFLALQNKYLSNATMRFTGAVGYTLLTSGNTALQYAVVHDESAYNNCTTSFVSPMADMLASARDLMFRSSIAASTFLDPIQTVDGVDTTPHNVYHSNYYYLGGAVFVTILATFAIMFTYRGYASLGRNPTMSPIEIAKAFNAPILQSHDGNAEAEDLLDEIGKRSIRYGAVPDYAASPRPSGQGSINDYKPYDPHVHEVATRRRLVMGNGQQVQEPVVGETFTG